jgi:HEPN domain-containing protein
VPPSGWRLRPAGDNTRELVENWRRSIAGLIFLAQGNLNSAVMHLRLKAYEAAVQSASTSVENVARALIHCYGGKPDESLGQEEPLRLLSRRFEAEERGEFDKAINVIACIQRTETASNATPSNPVAAKILSEVGTSQTIEAASRIISLYQRIMINHFREEIPELLATVRTQQYGVNWEFPN